MEAPVSSSRCLTQGGTNQLLAWKSRAVGGNSHCLPPICGGGPLPPGRLIQDETLQSDHFLMPESSVTFSSRKTLQVPGLGTTRGAFEVRWNCAFSFFVTCDTNIYVPVFSKRILFQLCFDNFLEYIQNNNHNFL